MPKDKLLFFIGIWLIVLSYFIGLPTEVKNYLFIATGLLVICLSYGSQFKDFKQKREHTEKIPEINTQETKRVEFSVKENVSAKMPSYLDTYGGEEIKVRKVRTEKKPRIVTEENLFVVKENTTNNEVPEEDVIVIASEDNG